MLLIGISVMIAQIYLRNFCYMFDILMFMELHITIL